ncbi:hypothetical protein PIB30_100702 [Stylosanthes scabra]|uniref:Uncharacterized protein n=1 Tax=Stylosanthes scabra TaxID=79078 RepID=A0ABU6TWP6_9FABA|nr:hypothetical protein [Stylosanthes scabra]
MATEQKTTSAKLASSKPKTMASESNVPKKASLAIIYNEHDTIIEDPEDRKNPNNTLFPFAIDDKTYCFVSPLLPKDQEEKVKSFFPTTKGRELLIAKDIYTHNFLKGKSFRNDLKTTFRGFDLFKGGTIAFRLTMSSFGRHTVFSISCAFRRLEPRFIIG